MRRLLPILLLLTPALPAGALPQAPGSQATAAAGTPAPAAQPAPPEGTESTGESAAPPTAAAFLAGLAGQVEPDAPPPADTAAVMARLRRAGLDLPTGLDPDAVLTVGVARSLLAAAGLDLPAAAGEEDGTLLTAAQREGLRRLLTAALPGLAPAAAATGGAGGLSPR